VGAGLVVLATVLWRLRVRVRAELERVKPREGRSAIVLGAGIMAVELPTAFPYFAAILAAVESARGAVAETVLVLAYNAVFVAPLVAVFVLSRAAKPDRLTRVAALVHRWAPVAVPIGVAGIGAVLVAVGASELGV
jgi:cytochrome c biogenesis protein CcdA